MSNSIKISPKHGLNPCIPICVFCGKEKDEVAIMGKLKGDAKAPRSAIIDYQPCDECLANWAQGVALIKVTTMQPENNLPPLIEKDGKKLYPTAQYYVIKPEAAKRCFDIDASAGAVIMMDEDAFDTFTSDAKKAGVLDDKGEAAK